MGIEIIEHGVMLTDYFHGTGGVWLNVPVDNETTLAEVIQGLGDEINALFDLVDSVAEQHNYNGDIAASITIELNKMREYIQGRESQQYASDLDYNFNDDNLDEFCELPQAIFTIEFIEG